MSKVTSAVPDGWSLNGRTIVVTGGSKGIGRAVVNGLLEHGVNTVIFCSRSKMDVNELNTMKEQYPNSIILHCICDVSTISGREIFIKFIKDDNNIQQIHGLVNNVGINIRKNLLEQTDDEYYNIIRTNIDTAYFLCKLLKPMFVETASIVNISSAAGVQSSGTGIAYGLSKGAINQFTRTLACEWAKDNIRVNAITPWMTMTPLLQESIKNNPNQLDKVKAWTPMHRLADTEEIAAPVIFLLLPASSYITGQILGVDGGLTAQGFDGECVTKEG